jgi:hypothetical protein
MIWNEMCRDVSPFQKLFPHLLPTVLNIHILSPPAVNGINAFKFLTPSCTHIPFNFTLKRNIIGFSYSLTLKWACDLPVKEAKVIMCQFPELVSGGLAEFSTPHEKDAYNNPWGTRSCLS